MTDGQNQHPPDQDRDAALAKHYDTQSEQDIVDEIEAAVTDPDTVMVQVPRGLLPDVLDLIEGRKRTA